HVAWKEFEGEARPHEFDPQRFINWRFFWDYSGGNVFENMVHQVAFWYKSLGLKIPRRVTMAGYNYLSPGMEVPDTMDVSMDQPENLLFTWNSSFGNNYFDCVRNRKEPNCPFELGYNSAIACQMAIASLRQGRTVQWDPEKNDIV